MLLTPKQRIIDEGSSLMLHCNAVLVQQWLFQNEHHLPENVRLSNTRLNLIISNAVKANEGVYECIGSFRSDLPTFNAVSWIYIRG